MKKLTLFVLFIIPLLTFSQVYDFTNSVDGWDQLGSFTSVPNSTFLTLMTVDNPDSTKKNPTIGNTSANVNATTNKYVHITLKNNSVSGPSFLRFSFPKSTGGRSFSTKDISKGDADFKTYTFNLSSNSFWTGTINDVKFHFNITGNGDYILPATPIGIDIDSVVIDNNETASSESFDAVSFTMSPNPAQNSVKIHTLNTISKLLIYTIAGSKVLESNGNHKSIDLSPLNSGIYFVKVSDLNNNLSTQKLIIQ